MKSVNTGYIYVMSMLLHPLYKVGWAKTYQNVRVRRLRFQTGNPFPLKIEAVVRGTLKEERALHWKMINYRLGFSEWFSPNPMISQMLLNPLPPYFIGHSIEECSHESACESCKEALEKL